ncbi:hypothetical protein FQA39_LY12761 [Lamprigera yunnana]|nr:hypothetical protein FQA39_LY12761 [Lamprigera yunnana]
MENTKRSTERRGSIVILTITIIMVIIIVIAAICVGTLAEGEAKKSALFALLVIVVVLGVGSCIFVEFQRQQAIKKKDRCAEMYIQTTLEEQRRRAPPPGAPTNALTSWAFTTPWKQNKRESRTYSPTSSLPPYSSPNSIDAKLLRLTPHDDFIYKLFREEFPNMDVNVIEENKLKSIKEKAKWRPFCEKFKDFIEDYSFGTLLRADPSKDYDRENSILVTRIQFYAIELARNREGINDMIRKKFGVKKDIGN